MIKCLFLHKSHKTPHCHLRQRGVLFWLGNRIHQIYFVTRLIIFSSGLLHTSWFATFHRIRVLHRKPPNRFGQPYFDFSIGVQLWDISFHQGCTHWFRHSMLGSFAYWDWVPTWNMENTKQRRCCRLDNHTIASAIRSIWRIARIIKMQIVNVPIIHFVIRFRVSVSVIARCKNGCSIKVSSVQNETSAD